VAVAYAKKTTRAYPFGQYDPSVKDFRPHRAGQPTVIYDEFGAPRVNGFSHNGNSLGGIVHKSIEDLLGSFGVILRPRYGGNEDVENPFVESWVVYRCIRLLEWAVAHLELKIWESDQDDADEVRSGPLFDLLNTFNPLMSRSQAFGAGVVHRKLAGEDFWFLMNAEGMPLTPASDGSIDYPDQIVPIIGSAVEANKDTKTGQVVGWRYGHTSGGFGPEFTPESVVHFYDYNPGDPTRGLGDVEVALRQISLGFQEERYLEASARNGGPGAFIVYPHTIDPALLRRQQAEIDESVTDLDRAGGFKALSGDPKITPNPANRQNMQSLDTLRWSRDVVASTLGVPLPCIGVLQETTFSNMEEAWKQFWIGVAAYLETVTVTINDKFIKRLRDRSVENYVVGFDLSKIRALQDDDSDRWRLASSIADKNGIPLIVAAGWLGIEVDPKTLEEYEAKRAANSAIEVIGNPQMPLSGHQVSSILEILTAVSEGVLDEDSAVALIAESFPGIDEEAARRIVSGVQEAEPEPEPEPEIEQPEAPEPPAPVDERYAKSDIPRRHPVLDREERANYAKALNERLIEKWEGLLTAKVLDWFKGYEVEQLERMDKVAARKPRAPRKQDTRSDLERIINAVLLTFTKWERRFSSATRPIMRSTFKAALDDIATELGELAVPMKHPEVVRALAMQVEFVSRSVTETTEKRIRRILVEGLAEGDTTLDIAERFKAELPAMKANVRKAFKSKELWSQGIARTETNRAANTARFEQLKRSESIKYHQWISSRDDHVRDTHAPHTGLDGQIRQVGEEFKPGLTRPHDPNGPAAEVIQCRCLTVPVIPDPQ
jgi:HK97 family phage portal protein